MWDRINSTRFKIRIAHYIFLLLKWIRVDTHRIVRRQGVNFELDLGEGIDLSIFLFGYFQTHITKKSSFFKLPKDAIIFDVGANFGSISLPLAYKYPQSTVFSFEPSNYAFAKLLRNIELNNNLRDRIKPIHTFLSSNGSYSDELTSYSSWRVDTLEGTRHPVHLGTIKESIKMSTTIDNYIQANNIGRLDFLKIDTEGYELEILEGAINSIKKYKPVIIFELSQHLLKEKSHSFDEYEKLLAPSGYRFIDAKSGRIATKSNINSIIPQNGSIDIIALQ